MERRAVSRVNVVVAVACVGAIVVVAVVLLQTARRNARSMQEAVQLTEIHRAWNVFANEHDGRYPVPGLIDRRADPFIGDNPRSGPEDESLNTTANLYSAMIAADYYAPEILISPFERNPAVVPCCGADGDVPYDFDAYEPTADRYWDTSFVADLEAGSNVSYAHLPIVSDFAAEFWRSGASADRLIIGNRGPADAIAGRDSYACRADGSYSGTMVFNDHHTEVWRAEPGSRIAVMDGVRPDNPFNFDARPADEDQVIAFTKAIRDARAVLQHD